MRCAVQAVLEKVKSFQSSHGTNSAATSGHDTVLGSGRSPIHSYSRVDGPIREESRETLTAADVMKDGNAGAEFLIRRQTLGELDDDNISAIRRKFGGTAATNVTDDAETTKSKSDVHLETVSQPVTVDEVKLDINSGVTSAVEDHVHRGSGSSAPPEVIDAEATGVPGSRVDEKMHDEYATLLQSRNSAMIETLQTYSVMDAMEQRQREQQQLEQKRREQKARKEVRPAQAADSLSAQVTTVVTIPDAGKRVPLSQSAIRASDVVTVDMLDRAISDDIRRLSTSCSGSVCVIAAMIVSRVLESACNRILREDRLPPATTWEEKARREAILLVEDVQSSAVIYVSRGGAVNSAMPARGWTSTSTKEASKIVHYVTDDALPEALTAEKQSSSEQSSQLLRAEHDGQKDGEADVEKDGPAPTAWKISRPSLMEQLSIIEPPRPTSHDVQENVEGYEPASKVETSDVRLLSLAQLSVIDQQPIARQMWSHHGSTTYGRTLPPIAVESILQKSADRVAAPDPVGEQSSVHDRPPAWQQFFANRRRSSVVSNAPAMTDVDEIDDEHATVASASHSVETTANLPAWRQLFSNRQSTSDEPDNT